MPSEKFFVHKEDGSLVRLKGRLVRFLDEEPPTGSDKSAIRTALEVSPDAEGLVQADVGTAPNEIPVNGMLGDMAYQSSEGISVDRLEVTDHIESFTVKSDGTSDSPAEITLQAEDGSINTDDRIGTLSIAGMDNSATPLTGAKIEAKADSTWSASTAPTRLEFSTTPSGSTSPSVRAVIDNQGRVGIGTSTPGSYNSNANNLVIGSESGNKGATIVTGTASTGYIFFADGTGANAYRGRVAYNHANDELILGAGGGNRVSINDPGDLEVLQGNLVIGTSGKGIDFGAVASGTGTVTPTTGGLLDDYETGTWTPVFAPDSGSFATATTHVNSAKYTKIGNVVTANCYIRSDGTLDTTGGSGTVQIHGLPFTSAANSSISVSVGYAYGWSAAPAGGYVMGNNNKILLTKRYSTTDGHLIGGSVSDLNTSGGSNNQIMISVTYQTA